jgi:hypothetical protein
MSQGEFGKHVNPKMAQERISILEDPNADSKPTLNTLLRLADAADVGLEVRFVPFSTVLSRSVHVIRTATNRGNGGIDTTYPVSAFFYQRTDRGYAGIMNISDAEISDVNCYTGGGNGFVWHGGNVCQGFPVFGVRYFGGLQPATLENIYQESTGGTNNPLYNSAAAMAYLVQGGNGTRIAWNGSNPSPVLYISSSQANCGGANIPLAWPSPKLGGLSMALTWSVLVTSGSGTVPPFGTGNFFILGSGSSGSSVPACGTAGMCTWTDTQAAATSGTVPSPLYPLTFWFWPVPFVNNGTVIFADIVGSSPSEVSSNGAAKVSIVGLQCIPNGSNEFQSAVLVQCLNTNTGLGVTAGGTVLTQLSTAGGGPPTNSKGLWNFGPPMPNIGDLMTLEDSNFAKTYSTYAYRPSNDAADTAIGKDQSGGLNLRASNSVSFNINSVPNNSNFAARITSSAFTLGASALAFGASVTSTDAGVSRSATRITAIGNGTAGDETGYMRSANTCTITSDITLPVNTATNVCQFSNLPASARNWMVHCYLPWVISAGTGTNTISIGVNASQTPAATTNFGGIIYTTANTAPVNAVTAVTTSGGHNIVASGTITPAATVLPAYLDGAIAASGTAGAFAVTMTAAGTAVTAASKTGAYCELR